MFDEYGFPGDTGSDYPGPTLETFVYCSRAAEGVDDAEVNRMVKWSQRRNVDREITGVHVFGSGVFFQWIEGPPAQVKGLIASLHSDQRHYDIVALDQSVEKRERLYPNWQMELVGPEDILGVLQDALEAAEDENNIAALKRILVHVSSGPLDTLGQS